MCTIWVTGIFWHFQKGLIYFLKQLVISLKQEYILHLLGTIFTGGLIHISWSSVCSSIHCPACGIKQQCPRSSEWELLYKLNRKIFFPFTPIQWKLLSLLSKLMKDKLHLTCWLRAHINGLTVFLWGGQTWGPVWTLCSIDSAAVFLNLICKHAFMLNLSLCVYAHARMNYLTTLACLASSM